MLLEKRWCLTCAALSLASFISITSSNYAVSATAVDASQNNGNATVENDKLTAEARSSFFTFTLRDIIWLAILGVSIILVTRQLQKQSEQLKIHSEQLKIQNDLLMLQANAERHKMFMLLTDCLSSESERTMRLHLPDHFKPVVYENEYSACPERCRSYLLMKRKYLYLFFSHGLEAALPVTSKGIVETWIDELAQYYEFHHVHDRQRVYYKEFASFVDTVIAERRPTQWMYAVGKPNGNHSSAVPDQKI